MAEVTDIPDLGKKETKEKVNKEGLPLGRNLTQKEVAQYIAEQNNKPKK